MLESIVTQLHLIPGQAEENAEIVSANPYGLTERERDVVALILAGLNSVEAGKLLGISRRSINRHRARVMQKFGARNHNHLAQLVATLCPTFDGRRNFVILEDISGRFAA